MLLIPLHLYWPILQISRTTFEGGPKYVSHKINDESQQLSIQLSDKTEPSQVYRLSMEFVGALTEDLRGFYLSEYKEGNKTL